MDLEFKAYNFESLISDLTEKPAMKATARSINRALTSARAEASKRIKKDYRKLKAKDIKDRIVIIKAKPNQRIDQIKGSLKISPKGTPADRFGPKTKVVTTGRGKRQGVVITTKRRYLVPGAFMGKMKGSGKLTVFRRKDQDNSRSKIERVYRISVNQLFGARGFQNGIRAFMLERFKTILEQQVKYEIDKAERKARG